MKLDIYTKVVLTVIALLLAVVAFDREPVGPAQAASGADRMIVITDAGLLAWHMSGDRVRICAIGEKSPFDPPMCSAWGD